MHHFGGDCINLQGLGGQASIDIGSTDVALILFIYPIADPRHLELVVVIRVAIGDHGCGGSHQWATRPGIETQATVLGDGVKASSGVIRISLDHYKGENVKLARISKQEMECTYLPKNKINYFGYLF